MMHHEVEEDKHILLTNQFIVMEGITGCQNAIQVESSIGFAHYLNHVGINSHNYPLFLKLIQTNSPWIVSTLVGKRDPKLLFSTIRPDKYLTQHVFQYLSIWHPNEIYQKVLFALLGVIESAYHKADDGYRIYPPRRTDLDNIGKFLNPSKDQFSTENSLILGILDKITLIGEYGGDPDKSILSKHAFNIRMAYFDNNKDLSDVIPYVLLQYIDCDNRVQPSQEYLRFLRCKLKESTEWR